MIYLRKSQDRGLTKFDWLDSKHTLSFGEYWDPDHESFKSLRVINEDLVAPGKGFPAHPHRDMEIITYIIEGTLQHRDNMDNGSQIKVGEVQRMTAGKGIIHSEYNASSTDPVHLLQIWILPEVKGLEPSYEQKSFLQKDNLLLIGSHGGREGSVSIHQDVDLYRGLFKPGDELQFPFRKGRGGWIQVVDGELNVNGQNLVDGDGIGILDEPFLNIKCLQLAEFLLFDMA